MLYGVCKAINIRDATSIPVELSRDGKVIKEKVSGTVAHLLP